MKAKKRCQYCKRWFIPDGRNKRQRVCSRKRCRKERERREWRRWAARHKAVKRLKLRVWAKAYPHYWQHYRGTHDKYCRQDNARRTLARKSEKSVRKAKADAPT